MSKIKLLILCSLSFLLSTPLAWSADDELVPTEALIIETTAATKGGGTSTIGTDAYDLRTQTAWFYGTKPIVTCFNHVETFGPDVKAGQRAIESSLKRWQQYFVEKKITQGKIELMPNVNFKFQSKCKGNEDLVIFLGTGPIFGNKEDLKAAQKLNSPAAYVNKTHMSRDMKWSKGYIRLVGNGYYHSEDGAKFPDWSRPGALEIVLTHELGHVLGFAHTPNTVMRADLVDQAFSTNRDKISVDGARELVTCENCSESYRLAPSSRTAFFESLGLKPKAGIRLIKEGKVFKLSDGKNTVSVQETSRSELEAARTLMSNFTEPLNDSSHRFNMYAFVKQGETKMPLVLEFNGAVVMRSNEGGELQETGRFEIE